MIADDCKVCQMAASKPRRLKLTVGNEVLMFNCRVKIDTMFLHGSPVVHMIDQDPQFCAAAFLRNHSATEILK